MENSNLSAIIRSRLMESGNPVILENRTYLCWLGENPPSILCDINHWDEARPFNFTKISDDLWVYPFDLPPSAYIEYAFIRNNRRIPDPYNAHRTPNGMGKYNHFFTFPLSEIEHFFLPQPAPLQGNLTSLRLPTHHLLAGKKRTVHFYQPPVKEAVPLLVMWDGKEYLERVMLPQLVEELAGKGKIQPIALALVENGGRFRTMEYLCSEATLGFLQLEVIPTARQQLNIINPYENKGSMTIGGASLGGLMSLYAALRMPHLFGKVISQSGAFTIGEHPMVVWDLIENFPVVPLKLWLDCGLFEFFIESNRQMKALLEQKGYEVYYKENPAGHNYPAWRRLFPEALIALFEK